MKNMKAKRKPAPNGSQGWASPKIPFDEYQSHLTSIARAVHAANEEYLSIVKEYLRWRNWTSSKNPFSSSQKQERFSQDDRLILEGVVRAQPPGSRSAVPQLLDSLRDTSYVGIWERAAENMAYLKSHPKHQIRGHQEKGTKRAEKLKDCRIKVETGFSMVEKELRVQGLKDVCDGILAKIDMLCKYEEAYPIPSERRTDLWSKFQTPPLLCISALFMLASLVPMCMAWNKSADAPGSTDDSDFLISIQNAIIQSVGLALTLYTVQRRSEEHRVAWMCAIFLTVCGVVCACVAVPMYLFLPTRWSTLASYGGSLTQLCVILEIAWMTDHSKLKQL
ncbi:hypothetical protein F5Y05DRAFT_231767 [Hypoxylon sp. FL0543]|nr:hypothetical protein F5Y05DRAFT_231767 [Hypoxylon sp. FL0543]